MGKKDTSFGEKYQELLVISHGLNYTEMLMVTQLYSSYVVISIVIITVMLAKELFYLTKLCSFLVCFFEYLPTCIGICLWYIIEKV